MLKITDELIEKFLRGDCTKEEAAMVASYLRSNPEEQYLLNEYVQADGETLPEGYGEEMLAFIKERTVEEGDGAVRKREEEGEMIIGKREEGDGVVIGKREMVIGRREDEEGAVIGRPTGNEGRAVIGGEGRSKSRVAPLRRWVAAAAVVILVWQGWSYLQPKEPMAGKALTQYPAAKETVWIEKYNQGKQEMQFRLPDSSEVHLSPGARVRYRAHFGIDSPRDVQVRGKVFFDVAKNLKAPFTVYSDGLQTRVLGTSFAINANPFSDKIKIKLLTGKVLVSLEGLQGLKEQKDYYLTPGQELVFTRSTRNVAINDAVEKRADAPVLARSRSVKIDTISNWYMFNNQHLADVFDQLSAIYNVRIEYSRDDLHNMFFIGRLDKRDSLSEIIQDIVLLNHLSVTSRNGRYFITKGKP